MKARSPHAQCAVVLLEQHDPRLTAEAQKRRTSQKRGEMEARSDEMEARRKRDGGELEARRRRRRDSRRRRGGGETADADEVEARWQMEARDGGEMQMEARWRRDGGEMEARRGRDGGGDEGGGDEWRERRGWLLTLTLTLTRVRSCGFSRRSHSEHPALKVSRRTCLRVSEKA